MFVKVGYSLDDDTRTFDLLWYRTPTCRCFLLLIVLLHTYRWLSIARRYWRHFALLPTLPPLRRCFTSHLGVLMQHARIDATERGDACRRSPGMEL